jgi:hypothetical protein
MHYEINISKNGKHYFSTNERGLTWEDKAREVFFDLCRRFPKSEGFHVGMVFYPSRGEEYMSSDEYE